MNKTLLECPWQPKEQRKLFQEGKRVPTVSRPGFILAAQLSVYTDDMTSAGTRDGGAGVIVTCDDPVDPTILHAIRLGKDHGHPLRPLTICTDSQQLIRSPVIRHQKSLLNAWPEQTTILWVPGVKGIPGDELAGTEPKKALQPPATLLGPFPMYPRNFFHLLIRASSESRLTSPHAARYSSWFDCTVRLSVLGSLMASCKANHCLVLLLGSG